MMCNKCRKGYGQGGWERDPEGNDEFCRWCSQGTYHIQIIDLIILEEKLAIFKLFIKYHVSEFN